MRNVRLRYRFPAGALVAIALFAAWLSPSSAGAQAPCPSPAPTSIPPPNLSAPGGDAYTERGLHSGVVRGQSDCLLRRLFVARIHCAGVAGDERTEKRAGSEPEDHGRQRAARL
jgi:hypothetical protein